MILSLGSPNRPCARCVRLGRARTCRDRNAADPLTGVALVVGRSLVDYEVCTTLVALALEYS